MLERVRAVSAAPIFAHVHGGVGRGALGTVAVPAEQSADQAARIAKAILGGTPPERVTLPSPASPRPLVDWREMRRFGIDESLLPPETIVMFREPSLWDRYRFHVLALLGLQSVLIAGPLVQRRRRQRAELEAQHSGRSWRIFHG